MQTKIPQEIFQQEMLSILYLDDEGKDLDNFKSKAQKFRNDPSNAYKDHLGIRIDTVQDFDSALQLLQKSEYNIFVCDHNMPGKRGLDFILFVKKDLPDIIYVLYTGAGGVFPDVKQRCRENDILFFEKTGGFSTLVEKLLRQKSSSGKQPLKKVVAMTNLAAFYQRVSKEIIDDMKAVEEEDPDFRLIVGGKSYSPSQIIQEISDPGSEFGYTYLCNYYEGLKLLNKK